MTKYIATPSRTREILQTYGFQLKKSLGQNFLIDINIIRKIIQQSGIHKEAGVIEIGPGIGSLTEHLARSANKVLAFEIDQRLIPILNEELKTYTNIEIINEDILKVDLHTTIQNHFNETEEIFVVANLPYYITTPIIMKILIEKLPIQSLTVMLQKEVAERMIAEPNHKSYGSLSIATQYFTKSKIIMEVPKTVFMPQPKVTSSVLKLDIRSNPPVQVKDEQLFFEVIQAAFKHRRKTILNNLGTHFQDKYSKVEMQTILEQLQIDVKRRAESLTIDEFALLAEQMYERSL